MNLHSRFTGACSLLLAALVLVLVPSTVGAHALGADCSIDAGRLVIEAYFSDDTPARHAQVDLIDCSNSLIAEGRTDADGRWSIAAPRPGRYQVTVNAGAGHRASISVQVPAPTIASSNAREHPSGAPRPVSKSRSRQEFTHFPWLRVAIGLLLIAGGGALLQRWLGRPKARAVID